MGLIPRLGRVWAACAGDISIWSENDTRGRRAFSRFRKIRQTWRPKGLFISQNLSLWSIRQKFGRIGRRGKETFPSGRKTLQATGRRSPDFGKRDKLCDPKDYLFAKSPKFRIFGGLSQNTGTSANIPGKHPDRDGKRFASPEDVSAISEHDFLISGNATDFPNQWVIYLFPKFPKEASLRPPTL